VVKAAYRSLAAQLHPDAGGDDRAMRRINEAYQLLNNALD
jgi:curved DNA-binding protein CbpA